MLDPELIKLASVNTYNYVHSCGLLFYINSIKYTYVTSAMCMVALITTDYVKSTSVAIIQGLLGASQSNADSQNIYGDSSLGGQLYITRKYTAATSPNHATISPPTLGFSAWSANYY